MRGILNRLPWLIRFEFIRRLIGGNYCKVVYPKHSAFHSGWVMGDDIMGGGHVVMINEFGSSEINPVYSSFREMLAIRHGCEHKYITKLYCETCTINFKNDSTELINRKLGNVYHR
jgi:hypothetical protein